MQHMEKILEEKVEQEQTLLTLLVNKIVSRPSAFFLIFKGDPDKQVASKAIYLLRKLLEVHFAMREVVCKEVTRLLFRKNMLSKAKLGSHCEEASHSLDTLQSISFAKSSTLRMTLTLHLQTLTHSWLLSVPLYVGYRGVFYSEYITKHLSHTLVRARFFLPIAGWPRDWRYRGGRCEAGRLYSFRFVHRFLGDSCIKHIDILLSYHNHYFA